MQTIKIIHFNDCYEIEKTPHFLNHINSLRDENTIVIFSGDLLGPSLESQEFKGFQFTDFFRQMKVDYAICGNHDLDFGMKNFIAFQEQFNTQWVMSNLFLKQKDENTNETHYAQFGLNKEYIIFQHGNLKIGLIGLVDYNYTQTVICMESFSSPSQLDVGLRLEKTLKEQGCDIIIALTHMLNHSDDLLQQQSQYIDLILGGHDHCYYVKKNNNKLVLKSGSDFNSFSVIEIQLKEETIKDEFLEDYNFIQRSVQLQDIKNQVNKTFQLQKQNRVLEIKIKQEIVDFQKEIPIDEYYKQCLLIEQKTKEKGNIPFIYFGGEMNVLSGYIRIQEMPITKLWADIYWVIADSDIAVSISGHLRSEQIYNQNSIFTKNDFQWLICFDDQVVWIQTPGWKIKRFFEQSYYSLPQARGGFAVPSAGLEIKLDMKNPQFNRVVNITLNGEHIKDDQMYIFSSILYSFKGKDGYTRFEEIDQGNLVSHNETTESLRLFGLCKHQNYWKEFKDFKQTWIGFENLFKIKISEEKFDEFDFDLYNWGELRLDQISFECMKRLRFYSLFVNIVKLENNEFVFEFVDQQSQRLKIIV